MGFMKPLLFACVISHLHAHLLQNTSSPAPAAAVFHQEPKATTQKLDGDKGRAGKLTSMGDNKQVVSVEKKGGGGGGGHGGGHAGGHGSSHGSGEHGESTSDGRHGASTVVPLYAAGTMGHRPHHGYNGATATSPHYIAVAACFQLVVLSCTAF